MRGANDIASPSLLDPARAPAEHSGEARGRGAHPGLGERTSLVVVVGLSRGPLDARCRTPALGERAPCALALKLVVGGETVSGVALSAGERTDLYLTRRDPDAAECVALTSSSSSAEMLATTHHVMRDESAAAYLFSAAAGFDATAEDPRGFRAQIRRALRSALRLRVADEVLERLFGHALELGARGHGKSPTTEQVVAEAVREFEAWRRAGAARATIASLHARAEAIRRVELARLDGRWDGLTEADRARIEAITRRLVSRVLDEPTARASAAADLGDPGRHLDSMRHLFGLDASAGLQARSPRVASSGAAGSGGADTSRVTVQ